MNLPNAISLGRLFLAPVFYVAFHIPGWTGLNPLVFYVLLWFFYWIAEISDIVDGKIARKHGLVSSLGKVLDPLSDVVTHTTYFFCFVEAGILPGWAFMIFLLRELGIILVRMILLSEGTALGAGLGGKIKSVFFGISSAFGLLVLGALIFGITSQITSYLKLAFWIVFGVGMFLSILSFFQYLDSFLRRPRHVTR